MNSYKRRITTIVLAAAATTAIIAVFALPNSLHMLASRKQATSQRLAPPSIATVEEFGYSPTQIALIRRFISGTGSQADYRRIQLLYPQRFAGNPQAPYRVFWTWEGKLGPIVWRWGPNGESMSAQIFGLSAVRAADRPSAAAAAAWAMWPVLQGPHELNHMLDESMASHRFTSRKINGFRVTITPGEPLDITVRAGEST